jgi:hypothetical protein
MLIAIAVIAIGAFFGRRARADSPSAIRIALDAPEPLRREIAERLAPRGLEIDPPAKTPALRVRIERLRERLELFAIDPYGRVVRRTLLDLETAAAWIESIARTDLSAPLLRSIGPRRGEPAHRDRRRSGSARARSAAQASERPTPVAPDGPPRAADRPTSIDGGASHAMPPLAPSPLLRVPIRPDDSTSAEAELDPRSGTVEQPPCALALLGRGEAAIGNDGAAWLGGSFQASTELFGPCLGLRGRVAGGRASGDALHSSSDRLLAEAFVEAAWPIDVASVEIAPAAALGIGWHHTGRGDETNPPSYGDGFTANTFGPRVELGLHVSLSLGTLIEPELFASWVWAPLAHRDRFVPALEGPAAEKAEMLSLQGEPWWIARLGLGVRFDATGIARTSR